MSSRNLKFALAAVIALVLGVLAARAQMLQVPGPSEQQQPSIAAPRQSPTPNASGPSRSTEEIPTLPPPPPPQAAQPPPQPPPPSLPPRPQPAANPSVAPLPPQQMVTVLPAVFRGCWQGQVPMLDSIERLPGAHKVGYWTPKTYRLCYRRVGSGPFKLTFGETGIAPTEKITNPRGHVDAIATDGRAWAKMRSKLHFDEYPPGQVGFTSSTFAVDETTMLECRIAAGGMTVRADVYGTRDGEPWFRAEWHADFRQIESAAER